MKLYLDTSVLVPLFSEDSHTARAEAVLADASVVVSDFAAAEFAAVTSRLVSTGELTRGSAHKVLSNFDRWRTSKVEPLLTVSADVQRAETYLRRLIPGLRTPDALHLALAEGADLVIATFDGGMARAAHVLGLPTTPTR